MPPLPRVPVDGATGQTFDRAAVVGEVAAVVSADDVLSGLESALHVLVRATAADDGEVFLCEPEGRDPLLCAWVGPDGDALTGRCRFEVDTGYPGIVVASGRPLCSQGTLPEDARYLRRAVTDAGLRSMVAAPLPAPHGALGSIHLYSRRDDFPVDRVLELLEYAALPISHAIRAGFATLRQTVDAAGADLDDPQPLRVLLESMRQVAGARSGTLMLIDAHTGRPDVVVSTGPVSLVCANGEAGAWARCASLMGAHGVATAPGRRTWPEPCRHCLPPRAASPCCLPLAAAGRLYGVVVLDFGREGSTHATARLVPLLTMAHQVTVRVRASRPGMRIADLREGTTSRAVVAVPPDLDLRCLGPFVASQRGQPIAASAFARSKSLVLLKLLAVKAGAPVHRDVLVEHLWPGVDPSVSLNRLHGVVHDLRAVIEPHRAERGWLYVRNHGELYSLETSAPIAIDVVRFRQLVNAGERTDSAHAADATTYLEQAIALYRGDLCEDEPYAEWCEPERQELRESFMRALEHLAQLYVRQGCDDLASGCLRRALRVSPFREDLLLTQMELLDRRGRATEAVAAYEEYRRLLRAELDADTSPALQAVHCRLLKSVRGPS